MVYWLQLPGIPPSDSEIEPKTKNYHWTNPKSLLCILIALSSYRTPEMKHLFYDPLRTVGKQPWFGCYSDSTSTQLCWRHSQSTRLLSSISSSPSRTMLRVGFQWDSSCFQQPLLRSKRITAQELLTKVPADCSRMYSEQMVVVAAS